MKTSRRTLLAGITAFAAAPQAATAIPAEASAGEITVAEECYARLIAAAHAPATRWRRQHERYAQAHWRDYVGAARAVLGARG